MQVDENDLWPTRVGQERWPLSFAWQTLREAGARLVFGSDWLVVTQNPLQGVSNAVNRSPWIEGMPDQRQTLEDTLIAYTRDAAYAEFQEGQKGQIREGYLADLVMLPKDLFDIQPTDIASLKPSLTMVDGRVVYEA
jgi:predicted amidohydrolase YtcJ